MAGQAACRAALALALAQRGRLAEFNSSNRLKNRPDGHKALMTHSMRRGRPFPRPGCSPCLFARR